MKAIIVSRGSVDHVARLESVLRDHFHPVNNLKLGLASHHYEVTGEMSDPIIHFEGLKYSQETFRGAFLVLADFSVHPDPWVITEDVFAAREWNSLVEGALSIWCESAWRCPIRIRNRELFDKKPYLMSIGAQAGASIPHSPIGKSVTMREGDFVIKAINAWQEVAPTRYLNTRRLSADELRNISGKTFPAPLLLQEYVAHYREYRVYLVGAGVVTILLDSADPSVTDFRLLDANNSHAAVVPTPPPLGRLVRDLGKRLSLDYLSIDVAERDGQFWLLDINPLASWNYLEDTYGLVFTNKIVEGWLA